MFLAVCARPRYDPHSKTFWDGKIGIYPIMELVPAVYNSKNRPKGTLETKNVTMDSAKYREMLVDHVLPDIHAKFRGDRNSAIFLQDDGAGPHTREKTQDFIPMVAMDEYGLDIQMKRQPPQSPHFNVHDCGLFNSLQKEVVSEAPANIDELIDCVTDAWDNLSRDTIDNVFLSVQCAMRDCLADNGDNTVKLKHMNKAKLRRDGMFPQSIVVPHHLVSKAHLLLNHPELFLPKEKQPYAWRDGEEADNN